MSAPPRLRPQMDGRIAERRAAVLDGRRRRRRRWLGSLVLLLALVGAAGAAVASPLFSIDEVAVHGAPPDRVDEVHEALGIRPGDNLAFADTSGGAQAVAHLAWVAEARVRRAPPGTVEVTVTPRRPAAAVRLEQSAWTVDSDGVVLSGGVPDEDALRIDAPNSVLPGPGVALSDAAVANALAFHEALPADVAARVARYEAPSERGLRMQIAAPTGGRVWVRVGTAEDVARKAQVVDALLEQSADRLLSDDVAVEELDVRVPSNPVLVPGERGG